jgi:hypothetical protein
MPLLKMKASSAAALPQQLARLQGMNGASMKPDLLGAHTRVGEGG